MAVSLLEVLEDDGYDLSTKDDALWLLSNQSEFERLISEAEEVVEKAREELRLEEDDED